jgi:hypothetical protein
LPVTKSPPGRNRMFMFVQSDLPFRDNRRRFIFSPGRQSFDAGCRH